MSILERKIAHKMTTLCSHITYPEFVLPLHKHAEYELMIYFKISTDKSIFQVLAEIRIEYACKLLANSAWTIIEVTLQRQKNS